MDLNQRPSTNRFSKNRINTVCVLWGLALILSPVAARTENALFVLPFGGEPGAPVPHAYDYGATPFTEGSYAMRIPNVDEKIVAIFPDTELTIEAKTKIVKRVHAERAYRAAGDCDSARKLLLPKLASALPAPYAGADPQWQYQSADGTQVGGAYCRAERYLPFPTLIFDLSLSGEPAQH